MKVVTTPGKGCEGWHELFPEYVGACLRGAAGIPAYAALRDHLRHCPSCAVDFASTLAMIRWREAEVPFNRNVLPLKMTPPGLVRGGLAS